jgi:hypothetical protein
MSENKVDVKRKSAESCVLWLESDAIGIISGLVHVEFQKLVSVSLNNDM